MDIWVFGDEIAEDLRVWFREVQERQVSLLISDTSKEIVVRALNAQAEFVLAKIAVAQHNAEQREREAKQADPAPSEAEGKGCCHHG